MGNNLICKGNIYIVKRIIIFTSFVFKNQDKHVKNDSKEFIEID